MRLKSARESVRRLVCRGTERGQSTVEYALVLVLISVPISLMMLKFLQMVIRIVVTAIVGDFTEGHI